MNRIPQKFHIPVFVSVPMRILTIITSYASYNHQIPPPSPPHLIPSSQQSHPHLLPVPDPLRHRLARLLDLLEHGLVRDAVVRAHVHRLGGVVGGEFLDACESEWLAGGRGEGEIKGGGRRAGARDERAGGRQEHEEEQEKEEEQEEDGSRGKGKRRKGRRVEVGAN